MADITVRDDCLTLVIPRGVEVWFDQDKLGVRAVEPYEDGSIITLDPRALMRLAPHPIYSQAT